MSEPQYQVLLYNDDRNAMEAVAAALCGVVASLSEPQVIDIMLSAHTHGVAPIVTADRLAAATYCQKLADLGLTCRIVPVGSPVAPHAGIDE